MNERELFPVNSLDEIPTFASEAEEAEYWSTHSFGDGLLELMQPVPFDDDELPPPRPRRRRTAPRSAHRLEIVRDPRTWQSPVGHVHIIPARGQSWVTLAERPERGTETAEGRVGSAASPRQMATRRLVATGPADD